MTNFLNILVDMKRVDMIKEIIKEFDVVYNKLTETELAVVRSVVELESQHLAQIAKSVHKFKGARNVSVDRIKVNIHGQHALIIVSGINEFFRLDGYIVHTVLFLSNEVQIQLNLHLSIHTKEIFYN